jgi:Uma2 family endonuclease
MTQTRTSSVSLSEFLNSPDIGKRCELVDGAIAPKMSPKRFHAKTQRALLYLLDAWGEERGEVGVEWAVIFERNGQPWVPVPDLLFVDRDRLPENVGDEACPVPPDLAVEIIPPSPRFSDIVDKATSYLNAGVACVWVVDTQAKTIVVFYPDIPPISYRGDRPITSDRFPRLQLTPNQVFEKAGLPD